MIVATEGGRMTGRITAAGGELLTFPAGTKNPWSIWRNAGRLAEIIIAAATSTSCTRAAVRRRGAR